MSTFCSIKMISLLFLQLILEGIKNGSKTRRPFQLAVFHVWHRVLLTDECTALTLWQRGATLTLPPTSALLGTAPQWCWGQDGSPNQLEGLPCIPIFPPTHQLGSSCSPCSQLGQGSDSCTISPLASDAVRQVRRTFCLIHLNHSAPLRRACRGCSNAGF